MTVLGFILCAIAAFRLRDTPLFVVAVAFAAVNFVAAVTTIMLARRGAPVPRLATAIGHVTAALGGFFLFVSFSLA